MEKKDERELIPVLVRRKEREEKKELPLEVLDVPIGQLLESREISRRWRLFSQFQ